MRIPFNKPYLSGKETEYINRAVSSMKLSGNGNFTRQCHEFFREHYGFKKTLLTTSCTDALEMAAILVDTKPGDEIIVPSYNFVSAANAFILRGAKIVFADSEAATPNIDATLLESLVTSKTKAIVAVHYAGVACDMEGIMALAGKHGIYVIEDAAHAIDSFHNGRPLGGIGHFGTFSFHETKNIISGEGGMLVVNDKRFFERSEIIWEKGTNRVAFYRGEVEKYNWIDIGSSFLPSELVAAFLYAQLENLDNIQKKRLEIWEQYHRGLKQLEDNGLVRLPRIHDKATNNAHMFYLVCRSEEERNNLIGHLNGRDINAVFHYLSLHKSPYYREKHDGRDLPRADKYTGSLIRLPLFFELMEEDVARIVQEVNNFYH